MGPGCESVSRTTSEDADVVVGIWKDGRIGVFRGQRQSGGGRGFVAFGSDGVHSAGHDGGYPVLLEQIISFFKTGKLPVTPEETIELFAFMSAADVSKLAGGAPIKIEDVLNQASTQAALRRESISTSE